MSTSRFEVRGADLAMIAAIVEWDSLVYDVPVSQVSFFRVGNASRAASEYQAFESWRDDEQVGIVSCRLAHDRLNESMFLEAEGFRFIEMVLHPTLGSLQEHDFGDAGLHVEKAVAADVESLRNIATTAFGYERFHVDPRLDRRRADQRYGQWVASSFGHPKQDLYKIKDGERLVGLFLIEIRSDSSAYWHLTAIAPDWQGQGYGRRVWVAMLAYCKLVRTQFLGQLVA